MAKEQTEVVVRTNPKTGQKEWKYADDTFWRVGEPEASVEVKEVSEGGTE